MREVIRLRKGLSEARRTGLTTVAILVVTIASALGIAKICHLGVAATVVTVLLGGGAPAGLYLAWASYRLQAVDTDLETRADQLAKSVGRQWRHEAQVRRLNEPYPLPVSWSAADPVLTDSWESLTELARTGAGWPSPPPRSVWADSQNDLAGEGNDLAAILTWVPTGRLVVLGEPGSGKTMLMIRLVLDLLKDRSEGDPVPVLASLASWNPREQELSKWLAARLAIDHPTLAVPAPEGTGSVSCAEALVFGGLVMPILDGLDEIPDALRGPAISRINDALQPGQHVVVTCRTEDYLKAVTPQHGDEVRLRAAAAVQLDPLDGSKTSRYLLEDAGGATAKARWGPVIDRLGTQAPVAQALTTPLAVSLARTIYNPRPGERAGVLRDPAELCSPELTDRGAVESLLLDGLIPAAYRQPGRWTAPQADIWLTFLAHHLEYTIRSPDLAWWQLPRAVPAGVRSWLPFELASGVMAGIIITPLYLLWESVLGDPRTPLVGFEAGGLLGAAAVLVAAAGRLGMSLVRRSRTVGRQLKRPGSSPNSMEDQAPALSWGLRFSPRVLIGVLFSCLVICLAFALVVNDQQETVQNLVPAVIVGLISGLVLGLPASLAGRPGDLSRAASPLVVLARDRRAAVARGLVFGLVLGLITGIATSLFQTNLGAHTSFDFVATVLFFMLSGLACGLPFISLGTGRDTAWVPYMTSKGWLAMTDRLPWRLMGFLADAHHRGVLRQAGAVYQFRHIELQRRLATRRDE
jgi:NACHT domain